VFQLETVFISSQLQYDGFIIRAFNLELSSGEILCNFYLIQRARMTTKSSVITGKWYRENLVLKLALMLAISTNQCLSWKVLRQVHTDSSKSPTCCSELDSFILYKLFWKHVSVKNIEMINKTNVSCRTTKHIYYILNKLLQSFVIVSSMLMPILEIDFIKLTKNYRNIIMHVFNVNFNNFHLVLPLSYSSCYLMCQRNIVHVCLTCHSCMV